jgi:hypothetical protein
MKIIRSILNKQNEVLEQKYFEIINIFQPIEWKISRKYNVFFDQEKK